MPESVCARHADATLRCPQHHLPSSRNDGGNAIAHSVSWLLPAWLMVAVVLGVKPAMVMALTSLITWSAPSSILMQTLRPLLMVLPLLGQPGPSAFQDWSRFDPYVSSPGRDPGEPPTSPGFVSTT